VAGLGWIDFSPEHRNKVASIIDLLKPEGSVDELGIGIIRNALADQMFPGINSVQKRAKYFFLIPRIVKDYQTIYEKKGRTPNLREYLREKENNCIRKLAEKYNESDELGIHGITLHGKPKSLELARKPSSIYWSGIRHFKIIETYLSFSQYLETFEKGGLSFSDLLKTSDDEKGDDKDAGYTDEFKIDLPDNNKNWDHDVSINLSYDEADFLKNRIIDTCNEELIGQILKKDQLIELTSEADSFLDLCDAMLEVDIPEENKRILKLAKDFDNIIHGAHIRYNCQIQEIFGSEEMMTEFEAIWAEWFDQVTTEPDLLNLFDEEYLIQLPKLLKPYTKNFVLNWINGLRKRQKLGSLDYLVRKQEQNNKRQKARLREGAIEKENDWVGIDHLNYRFPTVKSIIGDIKEGLEN